MPAILSRAGEIRDQHNKVTTHAKCEQCGVENHSEGWRSVDGTFIPFEQVEDALEQKGYDYFDNELKNQVLKNGEFKKMITIVLTVAHLDHDSENQDVDYTRLKALCQRCHLNYDKERHAQKRRDTLNNRKSIGLF